MNNLDDRDFIEDHSGNKPDLEDDFIPDSAKPLCPKCFKPCDTLQYYCNNCDSNETLNPLASYIPFVRIRFEMGMCVKLWRNLLTSKDKPFIYKLIFVLILIIAAPILLIVGGPLLLISKIKNHKTQRNARIAFYIILLLIPLFYVCHMLFTFNAQNAQFAIPIKF